LILLTITIIVNNISNYYYYLLLIINSYYENIGKIERGRWRATSMAKKDEVFPKVFWEGTRDYSFIIIHKLRINGSAMEKKKKP